MRNLFIIGATLAMSNVLRSPAGDDGGFVDPLDTNVQDVDTSYPILPAGLNTLRIKKVTKEPTKAGDGERLTFQFETIEEAKSTKGDPIAPGLVLRHYVGITEKTNPEPGKRPYLLTDIAKGISQIAKAAGYSGTVRSIIDNPAVLEGKSVRCNVGIQKETTEFPESNTIKSFVETK